MTTVCMNRDSQNGFTLIELVSVIVLLGILGVFSYQFFTFGVISYVDTASRDKTTEQGRFIVDRMSREIVNALPNSVRIVKNSSASVKCIEFLPVSVATGYISAPTIPASNQIQAITFSLPSGSASDYMAAIYSNDECSVYGIKTGGGSCDKTGDGNTNSADRAWHFIGSWAPASAQLMDITLTETVSYIQESPSKRVFIVSSPVAFCLSSDGKLKRHAGYSFNYPHPFFIDNNPPAGGVLMGENVDFVKSRFSYSAANHIRNGIVQMTLFINNHDKSEQYPFNHQVSLHNAP